MLTMSPYLIFNGEAAEALAFYQSVFGGQVNLTRFSEFDPGSTQADFIMHGQLETAGFTLMVSDNPEGDTDPVSARVTICIWGDEPDRGRDWFSALAVGGEVGLDFGPQVWGDYYGDVTDRYGVKWGVNVSAPIS